MRFRVIADWDAAYVDPIRVAAGEIIWPNGASDVWDGHVWKWARDTDGREGWLPESVIVLIDGAHRAAEDFDARELTCRTGEVLVSRRQTHGWAWCINPDGAQGWAPLRCLTPA